MLPVAETLHLKKAATAVGEKAVSMIKEKELLTISEDVTLQLPASDRKALGYDEDATIYLRNLTDQDLERLGVPQNNDVMYVNDQVCFRSYIAILEDYFSPSKHAISAF